MAEISDLLAALSGGDDQAAEAAAHLLSAHGAEAFKQLQPLLAEADPDARWWAVRALAAFQGDTGLAEIRQALQDSDLAVRQCAALGLAQRPFAAAVPELVAAMQRGDDLLLRLAANALIRVGAPAVPALIELLEQGAEPARMEAARALALIADPQAIPALFALYESDSILLEYWAAEGLGRMGAGSVYFKP